MSDNPLMTDWDFPPFDRVRPDHFLPAFEAAMALHLQDVEAVATQTQAPDFANTIEALERAGRRLGSLDLLFRNLTSSRSDDALDSVARTLAPLRAQHHSRVAMDERVFARVHDLYLRRETLGLDEDQMRLLERHHLRFEQSGATLPSDVRARMAAITERLAVIQTQFGQNLQNQENQWALVLENEDDLAGLPPDLRAAAARVTAERDLPGLGAVTLSRPSMVGFLTFSARRDLRRRAFQAWHDRGMTDGPHDNRAIVAEILALRAEQARLLGWPTYADFRLHDSMAKTVAAADGLLRQVWQPARRRALAESHKMQALARADGLDGPLEPWDWRYYAEKLRKAEYDIEDAEIRPYLSLDNMIAAAFHVAGRLFGLSFSERHDQPVYAPEVRVFDVTGADGRAVGQFVMDNFTRRGKRAGAWMSLYRGQEGMDGPVRPIVSNDSNLMPGDPTLLTFEEARTLFHEFGHGLHGLLSEVRYPSQAGPNVRLDFVEFHSQILEQWLYRPEVLRAFARHHQSGAAMPDDLIERIGRARAWNQGATTVEYAAAALLDLAAFTRTPPAADGVETFERGILEELDLPRGVAVRYRLGHFLHLFLDGGYAAGYYAYLWAETLVADGFAAFTESGDVFDPATAARLYPLYRDGDTRDPMALYRAFRGRDPSIEPLLVSRSLT